MPSLAVQGHVSVDLVTELTFTLSGFLDEWRNIEFTLTDSATAPTTFSQVLANPHSDGALIEVSGIQISLGINGLVISVSFPSGPISGAVKGDTIWPQVFPNTTGSSAPIATATSLLVE